MTARLDALLTRHTPWPKVTTSTPPSRAEVATLVTAARERHERRLHGSA